MISLRYDPEKVKEVCGEQLAFYRFDLINKVIKKISAIDRRHRKIMANLDFLDIDITEKKNGFTAVLGFLAIVLFIAIFVVDDPIWERFSASAMILITFTLIYLNAMNNEVISQQVKDSNQLVKAQTRPFVYVTLKPAVAPRWVILMLIENIGLGIARNIEFSIPDDFTTDSGPLQDYPLFQNGLSYLAPKETREFVLIDFSRRPYREFENVTLTITVKFKSLNDEEEFEFSYPLSFGEFNMMRYAPSPRPYTQINGDSRYWAQSATTGTNLSRDEE